MAGMPLTRASRRILTDLERDPEWFPTVLTRLACGDKWKDICHEFLVLEGAMLAWIYEVDHPERKQAYDHALRVRAEMKVHEALDIVDGDGDVARDKLRAEARIKVAGMWDRPRYGTDKESSGGGRGVTIVIQKFAEEKVVIDDGAQSVTVQ